MLSASVASWCREQECELSTTLTTTECWVVQLYGTFALADDSQADPPNRYVARWRDAKTFPASGILPEGEGCQVPPLSADILSNA
jgi:hypothetical protein